jgi:transcriptional regulator with XRE-family HTH domain
MTGKLSFGEWLDDQLREKRWTQTSFAESVDVSPSTVSTWISNTHLPGRRVMSRIARVLDLDINEVLVRAGYPPMDAGYRLPENRNEEMKTDEESPIYDDRVRFFAANADKLSEEDWEMLKRFIERLAGEEDL